SSRMTSAPRCASWSVENGPAQAHEKSITLTPSRGGLAIGSLLGSRLACEQLSVVLSEARRRPADGVGAHPRAERHGRDPVGARDRMSHVGEEASALQMLVRENLSHAIHRGKGDAPLLPLAEDVLHLPGSGPLAHQRVERVHVCASGEPILENLLLR